ncbi:MAG TPA: hypothetical protein VKM56_09450, partial [Verrucomicrobiae bacterium]|nr:hypothetical protein [Verrucomicrobiae bacterium]
MRRHYASTLQHFDPLTLVVGLLLAAGSLLHAENWPCWRGPRGDGTSLERHIPRTWNSSNNIAWKTELAGLGHASPIVWNDRIFTVTAIPQEQARVLLCLNRANGRILWQKTVVTAPMERKHSLNSHASSTPTTDGELVYVAFL